MEAGGKDPGYLHLGQWSLEFEEWPWGIGASTQGIQISDL